MKLSTKGRYGARLMLALANNYGKGPLFLKDIAKEEEISEKYLSQLILPLKSVGLVNSGRGAHGGYTLSKPPSKIRLSEVVQTIEGPLVPVECVNNPSVCHRLDRCVTRDIWQEMGTKIVETLDSITLEDMVIRQRDKIKGKTGSEYYI